MDRIRLVVTWKIGTEERAERREGGVELGGTEELRDPREGPVVPVKACDGEQQSVGDDGEEGEEDDVMFCRGAEGHSVIISGFPAHEKKSTKSLVMCLLALECGYWQVSQS
jgi:hypothetical protein